MNSTAETRKVTSCVRPVARLFKRGVHMCMGLVTSYYNNYACIGHNCLLIEV